MLTGEVVDINDAEASRAPLNNDVDAKEQLPQLLSHHVHQETQLPRAGQSLQKPCDSSKGQLHQHLPTLSSALLRLSTLHYQLLLNFTHFEHTVMLRTGISSTEAKSASQSHQSRTSSEPHDCTLQAFCEARRMQSPHSPQPRDWWPGLVDFASIEDMPIQSIVVPVKLGLRLLVLGLTGTRACQQNHPEPFSMFSSQTTSSKPYIVIVKRSNLFMLHPT